MLADFTIHVILVKEGIILLLKVCDDGTLIKILYSWTLSIILFLFKTLSCYGGKTSRPLEVGIKEHKYNVTKGVFEKSKLAQHAYEEGHKICWKEAKVLQF
jgi:hypothetical protein